MTSAFMRISRKMRYGQVIWFFVQFVAEGAVRSQLTARYF
jgi:hypothetical protein